MSRRLAIVLAGVARLGLGSAAAQDAGAPPSGPIVITPAPADQPVVRAQLSSSSVTLGEVFFLFIQVDHQPGVEVNLPAALPLGAELDETARTDRLVKNPAGGLTREFEIALMPFALGDLIVPAVPVTWAADGEAHELATPALPLAVTGVLMDADEPLRDIAPPVDIIERDLRLIWLAAGGLGAIVLGLTTWRVVAARRRRARRRGAAAPDGPPRPAHEDALARLAELEASGALDAVDRKPVYLALSEVVRGYLGRRFGFAALDLTTGEIRAKLAAMAHPGDALVKLGDWLERCDLVKYARSDASEDQARQALYEARIFVERTREGAAAATEAAPAAAAAGEGAA